MDGVSKKQINQLTQLQKYVPDQNNFTVHGFTFIEYTSDDEKEQLNQQKRTRLQKLYIDIQQMHSFFKDLNLLTGEQQPELDIVEKETENANLLTEKANIDLESAQKYNKTGRKILLFFGSLAAIPVGFVFGIKIGVGSIIGVGVSNMIAYKF